MAYGAADRHRAERQRLRRLGHGQEPSLYERLGRKPAITAVVDDFVANVAADNRIDGQFASTNLPCLKEKVVGAVRRAGRGLVKTLDKRKVTAKEKNELLGTLVPMMGDIVNR